MRTLGSYCLYGGDKMPCPTIIKIITINGCDHDMSQLERFCSGGNAVWLFSIQSFRSTSRHITKCAGARANIPKDEKSSMFLLPAFTNIWTRGFLTDRGNFILSEQLQGLVPAQCRSLYAQPVRFWYGLMIRTKCFLWMARSFFTNEFWPIIYVICHNFSLTYSLTNFLLQIIGRCQIINLFFYRYSTSNTPGTARSAWAVSGLTE